MKELSIEEKAKRYDEALKYAMIYYKDGNEDMKMMMKTCFPVLVEESEDEKIRKAIKYGLDHVFTNNTTVFGVTKEQCLAWLEKQGNKSDIGISEATKQELEDNLNKALEKETPESWNEFLEKQGEQKPTEWHREDEQNLNACLGYIPDEFLRRWLNDVIHTKYDKPTDKVKPIFNVGDKIQYLKGCGTIMTIEKIENGEYIFDNNMGHTTIESGNKWHLVEQKSAWSEGDEVILDGIIEDIEVLKEEERNKDVKAAYQREIDWLKSLRPQKQWKPSEEQILAIETAINVIGKGTLNGKQLVELQEQLKKLKG